MKKKVIKIVVDTDMTNEQIETLDGQLSFCLQDAVVGHSFIYLKCRNVQVLDSDTIKDRDD